MQTYKHNIQKLDLDKEISDCLFHLSGAVKGPRFMAVKKMNGTKAGAPYDAPSEKQPQKNEKSVRFNLATSVRNEGLYILEWIAHHSLLGFDKIYIFSNDNTDGSDNLLASLQEHGMIDWRPRELSPEESPQQTAFRTLSNELFADPLSINDYLLWLDCDEFLVLKKDHSISQLMERLSYPDGVFLNWKSFGSSEQERYCADGLTIEKYTYWDPKTSFNRFGKCISKIDPNLFRLITHHRPIPKLGTHPKVVHADICATPVSDEVLHGGKNPREMKDAPIAYELAQLNHYIMRSREEQKWKALRGPGFRVGAKHVQTYALKVTKLSINDTELEDETAKRYADDIRLALARMPPAVIKLGEDLQRTAVAHLRTSVEVNSLTKATPDNSKNIQHHTHHLAELEQRLANAAEICEYIGMVGVGPKSVLDIGCGFGFFLAEANKKWNLDRITGVDGNWIDPETLCISPEHYVSMNLSEETFTADQKYDLTVCLEVAEHLPRDCADRFVKSLGATSDIILFSAAFPGQGGKRHFNEQPMSYWATKFAGEDFQPVDILHEYVWASKTLYPWFRNNLVIFASSDAIKRYRHFTRFIVAPPMLDRVHPHYYNRERTRLREASVKVSK